MEPSSAAGTETAAAGRGPAALSVGEVVARIRGLFERQFPSPIWVEGELSNCSYPSSGHIYFSLVDEKATDRFGQRLLLPCAFFRGANQGLKLRLEDGMKLLVYGQVSTYEGRGQYQLRVLSVQLRGQGELQKAFEQLKKRLQAEGLFDESRKRVIPAMPSRIGVITSPSGSAIHDMVSKLRDWFHVIVLPVKVQGDGAAAEIAEAITLANRLKVAEVLIVGRGGGSVEDLWAFNEEPVARAIAASAIPVISAVGHQDDWTIADYVADLRASTPTDAAKLLVHDQEAFATRAGELVEQLLDGMRTWLDEQDSGIDGLSQRLRLLHPLNQLDRYLARAAELQGTLTSTMQFTLDGCDRHLQGVAGRLQALSPLAVLARGYSITLARSRGAVVTSAASVAPGDELETLLAQGRVISRVTETTNTDE